MTDSPDEFATPSVVELFAQAGEDYVAPQDRPAEWARMARELAASGYTEAEVAQALAVDEETVQRLSETFGEGTR
ncbi:hypothetical protein ACFXKX_35785 [Streptomyces scopuliridis]|uniref:hypothetical protein n=1 Tax=Streptomyces scopuliridis TaxID=452529 RepID=UPI0036AAB3DF